MTNETVAIVGSHPKTKFHAPFRDETVDIWTFNESAAVEEFPRWTLSTQMHQAPIWKSKSNPYHKDYYGWLQQDHGPGKKILMLEQNDEIPNCVKFPLEEITEKYLGGFVRRNRDGDYVNQFFSSSPAYAISYALWKGYKTILLNGMEMQTNTEYEEQKDGVAFWSGVAVGHGVTVVIQEPSIMMISLLYGYEGNIVISRQQFETAATQLTSAIPEQQTRLGVAAVNVENAIDALVNGKNKALRIEWAEKLANSIGVFQQEVTAYGSLNGGLQENQRYLNIIQHMIHAAGGEQSLDAMLPFDMQEMELEAVKENQK